MSKPVSSSDPQVQRVLEHYRRGELSGSQARHLLEGYLKGQGWREAKPAGEPKEGFYYPDASKVAEYNRQVYAYNRQIREARHDAVESLLSGQMPGASPKGRPIELAAYETASQRDPDILYRREEAPEDRIRGVRDTQGPISPFISELSPAGPELGGPADTRPVYGPGREPSDLEQVLALSRTPSQALRAASEGAYGAMGELPEGGGWQNVKQVLGFTGGVTGGAAMVLDPLTIPAVLGSLAAYAGSATWDKVSADINRTVGGLPSAAGEYASSRAARPELLASDIGFQMGSIMAFKGVAGLAGRAAKATGGVLSGLPGDAIGGKGLAVIGGYGEGPLGFKQILQVAGQRGAGFGGDVLGSRGLATVGDVSQMMPLKQLLEVVWQRGMIPGEAVGRGGLAIIVSHPRGLLPLKQTLEVSFQRASLRNILAEPAGTAGVAAIGSAPALLPFKQLGEVLRQRASLGSDILGPTGMGTRGTSLKALFKFAGMPGAVEPFTGVAHRGPTFSTRDISGILQIKAKEAAEFRAGNLEAFMRSTFKEPRGTVVGAPDTSMAQIMQMRSRSGAGVWGDVGAVDVFPYEVLSYPSDVKLTSPLAHVERPQASLPRVGLGMGSRLATRETQDLSMRQILGTRPEFDQLLRQRADQDLRDVLKMRQPQGPRIREKAIPDITLKNVLGQASRTKQGEISLQGFMSMGPQAQASRAYPPGAHPKKRRRKHKKKEGLSIAELRVDPLSMKGLKGMSLKKILEAKR